MTGWWQDGEPYINTIIKSPIESNGGIPVNVQDQTTIPQDFLFAQSQSTFTLSVDAVASTTTVLSYTITATAGHGLIVGDEILLVDTPANRALQAIITQVAGNILTIDRPIDHAFAAATTLGFKIITNMAVNGSAVQQIFTVNAGAIPTDYVRFIITMTDSTDMDDGLFGGLPKLTNGLVFRVVNDFQKTIFCFKTNGEIAQFCYDLTYADKAPAGQYGLRARLTFGGQDKHGVVLRISDNDVLQWVVQDDLTGLDTLRIAAQGHETQD